MKKLLLITLIILVITSLACITTQQTPELIQAINQVRLNTLNQANRLNDFAQYRFSKLNYPYLSHTNFRKDYSNFMGNRGYLEKGTIVNCGEIIQVAYDYKAKFYNIDTDDLIRSWLNSSSHREVILNEKWQNIGCYIGYKDQYTIIIVVEFDTLY